MVDFICEKVAEYFDSPCDYEFGSLDVALYMNEKAPDWCETHCDSKKYNECWKKFFELLKDEKGRED